MVKLLKIKRRDFFEWQIFPILVSSTVKAQKFKLLYFRNEKSFETFLNDKSFLFWCQALWKLRSSNCCIFEMKKASGMENGRKKNPLACLPRARPFFLAPIYFLLPATQANLGESSHVEKNSGCLLVLLLCLSPLRNVSVISKRDDRNYFLFWANHWETILSNVIWLLRSLWNVTRYKSYVWFFFRHMVRLIKRDRVR